MHVTALSVALRLPKEVMTVCCKQVEEQLEKIRAEVELEPEEILALDWPDISCVEKTGQHRRAHHTLECKTK